MKLTSYIPEGVADTHCSEFEMKENIITSVKNTMKTYGYRQVQTPTFEYYDLFTSVEGSVQRDEMFKFIDGNGKILVLRPDVTTPIARMVAANYRNCTGYLKFSYVTNIFRINEEQSGLKKEFTQAGIEYLGNEKPDADAEAVAVGIKSLLNFGFKDFQIDLGQARYFKGLINELGISKEEQNKIRSLIECKNFGELKSYLKHGKIPARLKEIIFEMPYLYGKPEEVIHQARKMACNQDMIEAIDNLRDVYIILKNYGYEQYISIDLGLIHHMDYYTGVIFKGYINNFGKPILSGGRYDNLTKQYGYYMPATGFGLNIDEIMEVLRMKNLNKEYRCYTDYLVLYPEGNREKGMSLAEKLRDRGFIVESDANEENMKKHIQNANYRNIREIIQVIGEELKIINIRNNQIYKDTIAQFLKNLDNDNILVSIH